MVAEIFKAISGSTISLAARYTTIQGLKVIF
jgi:hypothetical protein